MTETPVIKIGHLKILEHLILGICHNKLADPGEKRQHSEIAPISFGNWQNMVKSLSCGEIQGAFLTPPLALNLISSGENLKVVLLSRKGGGALVIRNSNEISGISDFKGKTILIPHELSIQNLLIHRLLSGEGLCPGRTNQPQADVFTEVMSQELMPDALRYDDTREIAGFFAEEPYVSQAVKGGYGKVFCSSRDLWPDHPSGALVMHQTVIDNHQEALGEIAQSLETAGLFMDNHPDDAAAAGAMLLELDENNLKSSMYGRSGIKNCSQLLPDISPLKALSSYMVNHMNLPGNPEDTEGMVDLRFVPGA